MPWSSEVDVVQDRVRAHGSDGLSPVASALGATQVYRRSPLHGRQVEPRDDRQLATDLVARARQGGCDLAPAEALAHRDVGRHEDLAGPEVDRLQAHDGVDLGLALQA